MKSTEKETKISKENSYGGQNTMDEELANIGTKQLESIAIQKRIITGTRKRGYLFIKRTFDIICSIFGVILMLPVAGIVKLSYIISGDFHSIFYKQKRIGKNGEYIYIYKLRSMVHNAEEVLQEMLKDARWKEEWDKNQKFENDPRITKIGNIIRKTSLDELPQFINVLKGDMSLIGPRPLVEGELDAHDGSHAIYESVRPGITGWWAANGRSCTDYDERLNLEYYYCINCSIKLDIKCVFRTIKAVLFRTGAK